MLKEISEPQFDKLIKDQFYDFFENLDLAVDDNSKLILSLHSTFGRAKKGHGPFMGYNRPEIEMERICKASGINPEAVKWTTYQMIKSFMNGIANSINKNKKELTTKAKENYYGIEFLNRFPCGNEKEFFQGIALTGFMDVAEYRKKTINKFQKTIEGKILEIGSGKEYPINYKNLELHDISKKSLSEKEHSEEEIEEMKKFKIIDEENLKNPNVKNTYLRHQKGFGICDDMSICAIGARKYGIAGMIGGMLNDASDTYTKFIPTKISGGFDEYIARMTIELWKQKYKEELITEDEILETIYLGAKNNLKIGGHSSSHRRFMQYEEGSKSPTFINHLNFINSGKNAKFKMGYYQIPSREFYKNLKTRLETYKEGEYSIKQKPKQPLL